MHCLAFGAAANKYFQFFSATHTQKTAITFLRFRSLRDLCNQLHKDSERTLNIELQLKGCECTLIKFTLRLIVVSSYHTIFTRISLRQLCVDVIDDAIFDYVP